MDQQQQQNFEWIHGSPAGGTVYNNPSGYSENSVYSDSMYNNPSVFSEDSLDMASPYSGHSQDMASPYPMQSPYTASQAKMRLKEWLIDQLDRKTCPGCEWLDRGKFLFKLPWKHIGKPGFKEETVSFCV